LSTLCMYIFVQIVHNINIYLHFTVHLLHLCPAFLQIHAHFPSLPDVSCDQDRMYLTSPKGFVNYILSPVSSPPLSLPQKNLPNQIGNLQTNKTQ
jgi:hypothetical protein